MIRTFPFRVAYGILPGELYSDQLNLPKAMAVQRVVFEACCRPPFDYPCAHLRLEEARLITPKGEVRLIEPAEGASVSLRDQLVFYPHRTAGAVVFRLVNLSGMQGRFLGGFVEVLDVET